MTDKNKTGLEQRLDTYKKDFMAGAGKNNAYTDPLRKQRPNYNNARRLPYIELDTIYRDNKIIQNIVDIPAEDMVRAGITISTDNDEVRQQLEEKLNKLDWQEKFGKLLKYKRLYGDGFISIGTTERQEFELSDEINPNNIISVDYIHTFTPKKVSDIQLIDDVFSIDYGKPDYYRIRSVTTDKIIHPSRIIRAHTDIEEDEVWGRSILEPMMDTIKVFDTALWSVGQILFDYTFKVYKTKDAESMTKQELQEARMLMDYMFRTEALALIAEDEELQRHTIQTGGITELLDFVWESISGAAQMPKNVILGQQQGTITGGQYDIVNYFNRVESEQESILKPKLYKLIDLILASDEFGMPDLDYSIQFNSLWSMDDTEQIDLKKKLAEIDQIYMSWDVLSPEEVKEMRFGEYGIEGELDFGQVDHAFETELINEYRKENNNGKTEEKSSS